MGLENYAKAMNDCYKAYVSDEAAMRVAEIKLRPILDEINDILKDVRWKD